ncbi:DUF5518 domain-containing protein [Natrinema ejinorense]|uniref:DUF5518 domain-containing protein n=1 Tax=Natrinema ejinorense TaxID=373386 RepID=A0A2A5QUX6_9EURY|nr:DUF5518 domain-containing protein [Natrinema ejinorense]PCR90614.1 hypothetical protein CP557_08900 [Natrinema ejinorense]
MDRLETIGSILAEEAWRYPIIAGLASIPFTLALQTLAADNYILAPVLVAGSFVGYLFRSRPPESRRVGWRTGLVGGLALSWGLAGFSTRVPETARTASTGAFMLVGLAAVGVVYIVLYGALGALGSIAGAWMGNRIDRLRAPASSN